MSSYKGGDGLNLMLSLHKKTNYVSQNLYYSSFMCVFGLL